MNDPTQLVDIIRALVESSRPGTPKEAKERAWEAAGQVLRDDSIRKTLAKKLADPEFIQGLDTHRKYELGGRDTP